MAWHTSTRSARLPRNWPTIRRQVRRRAHGKCQATTHAPGCNGVGAECDHIIAGDNHSLDNLQWLSHECHAAKTRRENASNNKRLARLKRRPLERHPGLIFRDETSRQA